MIDVRPNLAKFLHLAGPWQGPKIERLGPWQGQNQQHSRPWQANLKRARTESQEKLQEKIPRKLQENSKNYPAPHNFRRLARVG
jgi:hypothetical protein